MRERILKKYVPLLLGMTCLVLTGCTKQARTIADVQKSGTVMVAVGVNSEYPEKQKYLGETEKKLVDRFCESVSSTAEYAFYQQEELESALIAGKADLAIGALKKSAWKDREELWISEDYEQKFLFSVTRRGDYLSSVKTLTDQNVGVSDQIGEVEKQQLYQADGITLVSYQSAEEAKRDLKINVISSYVCFQNQAEMLAGDADLQIQDLTNTIPESRIVLVKAGNSELLAQVDRLIQEIKQE